MPDEPAAGPDRGGPALERHWAGWRSDYITSAFAGDADTPSSGIVDEDGEGSLFERILRSGRPDEETYILKRGATAFVILNAYPYNSGHLMVLPYKQVADFTDLTDDEILDLMKLMRRCQAALTQVMKPDGFNIGVNLGRVAGAGIAEHLHIHVVPRWNGDTNFMPVLGQTTIVPQALAELATLLRAALEN